VEIAALHERRDAEWVGFRNYLYGYNCEVLAEQAAPGYAVMLINASSDLGGRLSKEFFLLTTCPESIAEITISEDIKSDPAELSRAIASCERHCRPELHHSIWGRVAVENGKPVGLYVNRDLVRQPVTKHWTELD